MEFSEEKIQQVWEKARGTLDQDSNVWRKDECGAWINRDQYGSEYSDYGWKIENVSLANSSAVENLRPFHRGNSFDRNVGQAKCHVTADRTGLEAREHIDQPRNTGI